MKIIYPPAIYLPDPTTTSVFLAGSIDMGSAEDWQTYTTQQLADLNVDILNPRRPDWDSSWKQTADFAPFAEQVNWELDNIQRADYVLINFHPNTKAPITFMELGIILGSYWWKAVVCCPDTFYRVGNVDITCKRYDVKVHKSLDEAIEELRNHL